MAAAMTFPVLVNNSPADDCERSYARVSLPFSKGRFRGVPRVAIQSPHKKTLPLQAEPLARWPDGSLRVLHVTFPARSGVYLTEIGGNARVPAPRDAIRLTKIDNNKVRIATGRLSAVLGGAGLVETVRLDGVEYLGAGGIELRVTDGRGNVYTATAADHVTAAVELAGPLRAVVALRGKCALAGATFLDFRLRFEFLAGVPGFSLAYTFFNLERGQDFHEVRGIELALRLAAAHNPRHTVYQESHGLFSTQGRMVATAKPLDIAVDVTRAAPYVRNCEALGDDTVYPFYLNPPCDKVASWGAVSDGRRALTVAMDDFENLRPKSLLLAGAEARLGVWPVWAPALALQQGRSRQVTVRVALSGRGAPDTPQQALAALAQLGDLLRAQLPPAAYGEAAFFDQGRVLPCRPDLNPRFEQWLGGMAASLNTIGAFFDLGDTPDSGYQSTYIPIGNRIRRLRGDDGGRRYFQTSLHHPATKHNGLEDFEIVWVNNEYDVVFAIGTEFLRTGDMTLFRKLQWWARHLIDVDFLHYSDHRWHHRAQPAHSERHTTTGAYPSHFWTQGLAQYYLLTGDPDALEVIVALAEKTIENLDDPVVGKLHSGLNREIGWGILSMICAYEASGIERFDAYARELLKREIRCGLPADIPYFSFGHTSILLGAREYLQIHQGEDEAEPVRRWFLDFVELAIRSSRRPPEDAGGPGKVELKYSYGAELAAQGGFHLTRPRSGVFGTHSIALDSLAYAYELTGDRKYIAAGMRSIEALLDSPAFHAPVPEGKPYAMVYRTFINFLKAAADLGLLREYAYKH
jgi:hypothetical protein